MRFTRPLFLFLFLSLPTLASGEARTNALDAAFAKALPMQLQADFKAARENEDRTKMSHILERNHLLHLEVFLVKLSRERQKLTPEQMARVISFYRWFQDISEEDSILNQEDMIRRQRTSLANLVVLQTIWPDVPLRKHGKEQAKPLYDREAWRAAGKAFVGFGLQNDLLFIQALLVNYEMRHLTFTHLAELHAAFFGNLQRHAVLLGNHNLAAHAFSAYLANTKSGQLLDHYGASLDAMNEKAKPQDLRTTAYFLLVLKKLTKPQLLRLFEGGVLPNNLPESPRSILIQNALEYFSEHSPRQRCRDEVKGFGQP